MNPLDLRGRWCLCQMGSNKVSSVSLKAEDVFPDEIRIGHFVWSIKVGRCVDEDDGEVLWMGGGCLMWC